MYSKVRVILDIYLWFERGPGTWGRLFSETREKLNNILVSEDW